MNKKLVLLATIICFSIFIGTFLSTVWGKYGSTQVTGQMTLDEMIEKSDIELNKRVSTLMLAFTGLVTMFVLSSRYNLVPDFEKFKTKLPTTNIISNFKNNIPTRPIDDNLENYIKQQKAQMAKIDKEIAKVRKLL